VVGHHKVLLYGDAGTGKTRRPGASTAPTAMTTGDNPRVIKCHAWYYHAETALDTVDDCTKRWFREFLVHGTVWTGASNNAAHRSQRLSVKPMKSSDWPRSLLGPSWPSSPSIPEWMEMIRKGLDPFDRSELLQPETDMGYTRVSRCEVSENPYLATRIATNAIVGVRSSVEVPRKFLAYFRYRHNFLVWTVTYNVPIGLVRFLLSQWTKCPSSLWLRRAVPLKTFLRKVPSRLVRLAKTRAELEAVAASEPEDGACAHSADLMSDSESFASSDLD